MPQHGTMPSSPPFSDKSDSPAPPGRVGGLLRPPGWGEATDSGVDVSVATDSCVWGFAPPPLRAGEIATANLKACDVVGTGVAAAMFGGAEATSSSGFHAIHR